MSPTFALECRGTSRCTYEIEARDEDEARRKWEAGDVPHVQPYYEIEGEEIVNVERVSE